VSRGEAFTVGPGLRRSSHYTVSPSELHIVAEALNNTIRKVTPDGVGTTIAGTASVFHGSTDGTRATARFFAPWRLAVAGSGTIYVGEALLLDATVPAGTSARRGRTAPLRSRGR